MDFSSSNTYIWGGVVQFGLITSVLLAAHFLRRGVPFIRKTLMPTSVLAGFMLLLLKETGLINADIKLLEMLTYHCIAIGFIAMSLRIPDTSETPSGKLVGLKSGAIISGSYMIQGSVGLLISILLANTSHPDLFPASGLLLPMGYGQGPGQANNIGSSYEAMGFAGGRSFGLALAAAGYICACVVGVAYINFIVKSGKIKRPDLQTEMEKITIETFQMPDELPIAESVDRFSVQVILVAPIYLLTFVLTKSICTLLAAVAPGLASMVSSLLWGFNFMIGSGLAILARKLLGRLKEKNVMEKQYQNNYLLSRLSGLSFDIMITAGIASIEPENLSGLWIPFILMSIAGGFITFCHLKYVCRKAYPGYYYEGLLSMYGMMTGTISSGILLVREIDPNLKTPAAGNLVLGSSFAILLSAPLLIFVSLAARSLRWSIISAVIIAAYYVVMLGVVNIREKRNGADY